MTGNGVTFRNRVALFYWAFAVLWFGMLGVFTYLYLRDGVPSGTNPALMVAVLGLFWVAGIGLAAYTCRQPVCSVTIAEDGATFVLRYPLGSIRTVVPAREVESPTLVAGTDSEGDPYFRATVVMPDGPVFTLAEGHDRDRVEDAIRSFERALSRG